ncbi:MAG: hypothetical protein COB01_06890 [Lutibacter sp.]|nr:MAG: hypothetical protein COB01_06890 [Lutibacter sp.]
MIIFGLKAKGGIYTVGLITPVSRLWKGAHWLTDVTFGIVLSVIVVDGIDNFLANKKSEKKKKNILWNVKAGVGTIGVVGTF